MATDPRNTDGLAPHTPLDEDGWQWPPADSLEEKWEASWLLSTELHDAQPWRNMDAYLRHQKAALN